MSNYKQIALDHGMYLSDNPKSVVYFDPVEGYVLWIGKILQHSAQANKARVCPVITRESVQRLPKPTQTGIAYGTVVKIKNETSHERPRRVHL